MMVVGTVVKNVFNVFYFFYKKLFLMFFFISCTGMFF